MSEFYGSCFLNLQNSCIYRIKYATIFNINSLEIKICKTDQKQKKLKKKTKTYITFEVPVDKTGCTGRWAVSDGGGGPHPLSTVY